MVKTKKQRKIRKKKSKKGVGGKDNNIYFSRLGDKSVVVKNMLNNLGDSDDFMGFFLDLTAKYYNELSIGKKKEALELLLEFLETKKIKTIENVNPDVVIGLISVSRVVEIRELFRELVYLFVKKFDELKLKKEEKEEILKLADLTHPDDLIVRESFEKKDYYDPTIFNLFDDFIKYSIEEDINHIVLRRLLNMGFYVRFDYSTDRNIKVHRAEELKNVIEKGSFQLFKILVENGKRNTKIDYDNCHMLNWSVFYERLDIVKYLIEKEGHNINEYCNNSYSFPPKPDDGSPLYNAVLKENTKIVKYLIEKGADVNSDGNGIDGETPAFAAVKLNNFEILKILVENGADLDTQTEQGELAYEKADDYENQEMIDYLLANGARTKVNEEDVIPDFDPDEF